MEAVTEDRRNFVPPISHFSESSRGNGVESGWLGFWTTPHDESLPKIDRSKRTVSSPSVVPYSNLLFCSSVTV